MNLHQFDSVTFETDKQKSFQPLCYSNIQTVIFGAPKLFINFSYEDIILYFIFK